MKIIINADDFGGSEKHTSRIIELLLKNKITSATFLVNTTYSDTAAAIINEKYPQLAKRIGLHLNFISSSPLNPLLKLSPLVDGNFIFIDFRKQLSLTGKVKYLKQIVKEIDLQIEKFYSYFGIYPTHIDSHGHTHCTFTIMCAIFLSRKTKNIQFIRLSRQYDHEKSLHRGAKFRLKQQLKNLLNYCYRFKFLTVDYFTDIKNLDGTFLRKEDLDFLSTKFKTVEIMTHPYYTDDREYEYLSLDNNSFSTFRGDIELSGYTR